MRSAERSNLRKSHDSHEQFDMQEDASWSTRPQLAQSGLDSLE
jgi:hypothetical protein